MFSFLESWSLCVIYVMEFNLSFLQKKQYVLLKAEPSLQLQIQVLNQKVYFVKHLEVDSFINIKAFK